MSCAGGAGPGDPCLVVCQQTAVQLDCQGRYTGMPRGVWRPWVLQRSEVPICILFYHFAAWSFSVLCVPGEILTVLRIMCRESVCERVCVCV